MWLYFYQIELVGKQLEESIKPLAFGSWFYAFLSLFANSFNLVRYSSRGGQENQLGWRLVGFLVHHSLNILRSNTRPRDFRSSLSDIIVQGVPPKSRHSWETKTLGTSYSET